MKKLILLVIFLQAGLMFTFSDTVYLKDQTSFKGTIINTDADSITFITGMEKKVINQNLVDKVERSLILSNNLVRLLTVEQAIDHFQKVKKYENNKIGLTGFGLMQGFGWTHLVAGGITNVLFVMSFFMGGMNFTIIFGISTLSFLAIGLPLVIVGMIFSIKYYRMFRESKEQLLNYERTLTSSQSFEQTFFSYKF